MRLRVRFDKRGKIRFLSHRDVARAWERALRRAGVRVAYSEGFSPRPRLSFGLALSTGYESFAEYLDVDLHDDERRTPAELAAVVTPALPAGMSAQAAVVLPPGAESLQAAVTSSSWRIELPGVDRAAARDAVERALTVRELPIVVERKGAESTLDARPAILTLTVAEPGDPVVPGEPSPHQSTVLEAELATQPRSLRPAELLRALDPTWREGRVLRTHQWTLVDGARCEPIPLGELGAGGATSTPHVEARAS